MDSKLILVEGIPGAGKTTTAKKLKENIVQQGCQVNLYEEGMSHPADMAWNAYLTVDDYNQFLEKCHAVWANTNKFISFDEVCERVELQARHENNHIILAYTRIDFPESEYWRLIGDIAKKEIGDGRSNLNDFKSIHLHRWSRFSKEAQNKNEINIFECAFLQNHIFELMGVYEKSDSEIIDYLSESLSKVKMLNPSIVYIKPLNIEKIILQAAKERKAPDDAPHRDWIDEMVEWVENTNYGKTHKLKGVNGVVKFCEERLRIDEVVIKQLNIPVTTINRC